MTSSNGEGKHSKPKSKDDDASTSSLSSSTLLSWQENYLYLAPSKQGTGWGVYAAKPFQKGDIVEIAPLFLRYGEEESFLKQTILDNYHYEYWRWTGVGHVPATVLSFGYTLFYNHADIQNIKYMKFGDDPVLENPALSATVGYFALRDIQVGEELLCTYGGQSWFQQRELYMMDPNETTPLDKKQQRKEKKAMARKNNTHAPKGDDDTKWIDDKEWREKYTSKIYSGPGKKKFKRIMKSISDRKSERKYQIKPYYKTRVAPWDAGYLNARAKVPIPKAGTLLEIVPALIMSKSSIQDSTLDPIVLYWNDIELDSFDTDATFQDTVQVLTKGDFSEWRPQTKELSLREETVLLPIGGSLALIERTCSETDFYNCKLANIRPDRWNEHAFTISIVATQPIEMGDKLVLKMANISSSPKNRDALWTELVETGQPLPPNTSEFEENGVEDGDCDDTNRILEDEGEPEEVLQNG